MAGAAYITATRYTEGQTRNCFYIGTVQDDGYVYFNDATMFRCRADGSGLQLFYFPKTIWVGTNNLSNIRIISFDVSSILGNLGDINGGSGAISPYADVEAAVKWMIDKANTNAITYSQTARNLKNPAGMSFDCSSFVITGFFVGGIDVNATYTGNMRAGFTAMGFEWIPGSVFPASACLRGDILLNEANHTQVYIGNNQDVNCGSTPARVQGHAPDNYGRGWNGILRYKG